MDTLGKFIGDTGKNKPYFVLFGLFFLFHIFYDPMINGFFSGHIRLILLFAAFGCIVVGVHSRADPDRLAFLIVALGVLIRISYVLYTGVYTRQHDIGGGIDDVGHIGYIVHFARKFSLPESNRYQLYHPPLHHFIAGIWYRLSDGLGMHPDRILESIQYLTAFYSSCLMVVSYRIFQRLKLTGNFLLAALALAALHPTFFILGGSVNNDMLFILLYTSTILRLMKWYDEPSMTNTVVLAVVTGLSLMAKTSGVTLAFVIGPFLLLKLIRQRDRTAKLFTKLFTFAAVSLPIGLWYSIRNLIAFQQPLGFVPHPNLEQYHGDIPIASRIFSFSISEFAKRYVTQQADYNVPVFALKTSLFGEWEYNKDMDAFSAVLIVLNIILISISVWSAFYILIKLGRNQQTEWRILFIAWVVQIVFFIYFNIQLPYTCTMDFRYIAPTLICGAGFIGFAYQYLAEKRGKEPKWLIAPVIAFCLLSSLFYLLV